MKQLNERIWRHWSTTTRAWPAVVAIECARLAPSIGYDASRRAAVARGCPVALWRVAYLCEMGK